MVSTLDFACFKTASLISFVDSSPPIGRVNVREFSPSWTCNVACSRSPSLLIVSVFSKFPLRDGLCTSVQFIDSGKGLSIFSLQDLNDQTL